MKEKGNMAQQDQSSEIESAIISNQPEVLEALLKRVDVNTGLHCDKWNVESPLILAVKLSHGSIVKTLVSSPHCNLFHHNFKDLSPLDLALVMVFDNQKEPRQSACWDILETLLETGAELARSFAIQYCIRSASKLNDDQFLFHLIHTLTHFSTSLELHGLLLWQIRCTQPLYSGTNGDEFLERASDFTVKLIKWHGKCAIVNVIDCFSYYTDAHWESKKRKKALIMKLVVYVTVCGWKWQHGSDLTWLATISPGLAQWCRKMSRKVHSLTHLCRLSLASSQHPLQKHSAQVLPSLLRKYIDFSDIDDFVTMKPKLDFNCIQF